MSDFDKQLTMELSAPNPASRRHMGLRLEDSDGTLYRWAIWRDARKPAGWVLRDHTGYLRTLSATWSDSVPMVHLVADNHGLKFLTLVS